MSGPSAWLAGLGGAVALTTACSSLPPARPPAPPATPTPAPASVPAAPAPRPARPSEGRVDVGAAGGLWYRIVGSAADTVLVPLGAYLSDALAPLAASHTVVFYDPRHRGHSDSYRDSTLSTFQNDVNDMETVRQALGISRMAIVGFSYYGAVAAAYASRHKARVSRLVLISPIEPTESLERAYDPAERRTRVDTARARSLLKLRAAGRDTSDPVAYCRAFWQLNMPLFVGNPVHAARIAPAWCELANEAPRSIAEQMGQAMTSLGSERDFARAAAGIDAPTLVVYGDGDLVANPAGAAAWARLVPGARALPIPGTGHFAMLEDREAVVQAIARFLRE